MTTLNKTTMGKNIMNNPTEVLANYYKINNSHGL